MSSDEAYGAFLDQANQDTGTSKEDSITTTAMNTKSVDTEVPHQLQNIKQYYTSEVDEPFEPVSLKWNGSKLPTESKNFYPGPRDLKIPPLIGLVRYWSFLPDHRC